MICTTVVEDGATIAFACYDEERSEIILESGYRSIDDAENLIENFLDITKPNLLLLGNKILNNAPLFQMLTKPQSIAADVVDDQNLTNEACQSIPYRLLKSGSFDQRACKSRILQKLRVLSLLREEAREHARGFGHDRNFPLANNADRSVVFRPSAYHSLATLIDFDSKAQVQALGALVSFLQDSVFRLADEGLVTVDRIVLAKSYQFMRINSSTLSSLHIFSTEHHPLIAKGQGNSKEGWSLFSLLDRTKSKGGRRLLKEWMLRPLVNVDDIIERQNAVEVFMQPALQTHVGILLSFLQQIGSVDNILLKMQKCSTQANDFLILMKTLAAALSISSTLGNDILPRLEHEPVQAFLHNLLQGCNVDAMFTLKEQITAVIDEDATVELNSGIVIRRGFHPQLDEWRDQYEDLDCKDLILNENLTFYVPHLLIFFPLFCLIVLLEEVAGKLHTHFPHLKDLSVVFVPQVSSNDLNFDFKKLKPLLLTRSRFEKGWIPHLSSETHGIRGAR